MTDELLQHRATDAPRTSRAETEQQKTADVFDSFNDTYSETVNDALGFSGLKVDFFTRVKADYIKDIAARHFDDPREAKVLDVGCGIGNYHALLGDAFKSIDGIDVSAASIDKAKQSNSIRMSITPSMMATSCPILTIVLISHIQSA